MKHYKNTIAKLLLFSAIISVALLISYVRTKPDGLLHIVFCDVGQGDAIYIRTPDGKDILIDGGPGNDVLNCLSGNMAFWDRTIEMVVLTHPQYDHFRGLIDVFKRYNTELFLAPSAGNSADSYQTLISIVRDKNVPINNPYAGSTIKLESDIAMKVLWPDKEFVAKTTEAENNVLGAKTTHSDLNDFSITLLLTYNKFDVLFTGDLEADYLDNALMEGGIVSDTIEVFKAGHHGAKAGMNEKVLKKLMPDLAVISVGEGNRYGHPDKEVLALFKAGNIQVLRTDVDGEIEVVTDGSRWKIK